MWWAAGYLAVALGCFWLDMQKLWCQPAPWRRALLAATWPLSLPIVFVAMLLIVWYEGEL
jgi:hypothetical protein